VAAYLVVRVTDVSLAPLDATVEVQASRVPLEVAPSAGAGPGVYEAKIPPLARLLNVRVRRPGAFEIAQDVAVAAGTDVPAISLTEPSSPWVRSVAVTSRGPADVGVDVHVILGGLKDALTSVLKVASRPPPGDPSRRALSFPPRGRATIELVERRDVAADRPPRAPIDVVRHYTLQPEGKGRVLFLARPTAPSLVCAWVPPGFAPRAERRDEVGFHVHFPGGPAPGRAPPAEGPAPDPVTWPAVETLYRTLYVDRLAYQHEAARRRAVLLVVPGAERAEGAGGDAAEDVASAAGLARLLAEVAWWLARLEKQRWPLLSPGRVAVSAARGGLAALERLLAGLADPAAPLARTLSEVYVFGGGEPVPGLAATLAAWLESGGGGVDQAPGVARVHDVAAAPWEPLRALLREPPIARRVLEHETLEVHGERGSLLVLPAPLLAPIAAPERMDLPGVLVRLFAYPALAQSGFAEWTPPR
jgi:hypothetical protein